MCAREQEEELALYVSTVRRAWSLLESDAFILMRGLGEEARAPDLKDGDIAYRLVSKSGITMLPKNLLAKESISFNIDQWSTEEEIEAERLRLLSSFRKIPCDILKNEQDIYESSEDSDLLQRVSFTKQILSRLLNLIRDTNNTKQTAYLTKWMDLKTIQDENLSLQGEIEKLQEEVINARAELYSKTYQLTRLHHRMDKSEEGIPSTGKVVRIESTQQHVESGSAEQSSSALVVKEPDQHRDDGQFEQIKVLERQIMESEAARTKAENALTEVLALKSINGKDDSEETRRLKQAMYELTQRFQAKVSELSKEVKPGSLLYVKSTDTLHSSVY